MNRKLKMTLIGAGLLAATGLGAGAVMAEGDGYCGHGPHAMRGAWGGDFKGIAAGRLDRLHADLKLRAEQEAAWSEFRAKVSDLAARAGEKAQAWRASGGAATAVERLERVQQGLDEGRGALEQLTAATRTFYATLDKEQQARFDELTRRFPRGHGRGA
ncbi:MAG: Spy/CpxP family protein refolding chaperone [Rhodocyclales bacterium]|nr:Spy/CpxP family protein refolding chaperone [Rhodocyclales bacterium]